VTVRSQTAGQHRRNGSIRQKGLQEVIPRGAEIENIERSMLINNYLQTI